jgi:hypothetical protein
MAPRDRHHSPGALASALALAGLVTPLIASHHPALAQAADPDFWQTSASVRALAVDGNTLYLGGGFDFVGPWTGGGVPIDPVTAAAVGPYARVQGTVYTIAPDGAGGFYLGGDFDRVGGFPRANLARVHAGGTVDAWNPGSDGIVRALAISGSLIYVGGDFAQVEGKPRARLAAVDAATGVASAWNPSANAPVYALAVQGTNVYAAGEFNDVGGQFRAHLAAIRTNNGNPTAWAPNPDGPVYALESDGTTLWVGGLFTTADGVARGGLASFTFATGALTAWQPAAIGRVDDLHLAASALYVSGAITSLGGQPRGRLGAVDAASGALLPFDAAANQDVHAILVQGATVYAGGKFSQIGGQARHWLGALDATTGAATAWAPSCEATVRVLASQGPNVYAGGAFRLFGGVPRRGLAAIDLTTKAATAWNPGADSFVNDLLAQGGTLYVGGAFDQVAGTERKALAAFDLSTGDLAAWNPVVGGTYSIGGNYAPPVVSSMGTLGPTLYIAGVFLSAGGPIRYNVAELDRVTGAATAWDPGTGFVGHLGRACLELDVGEGPVYLGGTFSSMAGEVRGNFAGVDPSTGNATSEAPNPDFAVTALERSATRLYLGGNFTTAAGETRSGLAALDRASGALTAWNPDVMSGATYGGVLVLRLSGPTLYAGGTFQTIGGVARSRLAAFDETSGALLDWSADADEAVREIVVSGGRVFVGGDFGKIDGEARRGLAVFDALPVVGVAPERDVASAPRVLASAPSPAIAGALLRFTLPRASSVSLALYDAAGKRVRTLVERRMFEAGEQRVPLAAGLAPGLYFLRLEAGRAVATGKLVLTE